MDPSKLSGVARRLFGMIEFDEDEQLVREIRKHPFGLFLIYLGGGIISLLLFAVLVLGSLFISDEFAGSNAGSIRLFMVVTGLILTLLSLVMTAIGAYLYRSNVMLVTSEKIAQVLYKTIFDRKISQLSIGDVQDVTVTQVGIFARIFDFGTIVIETAGEQANYGFTYTPDPYESAKAIVGAHERNLKAFGN